MTRDDKGELIVLTDVVVLVLLLLWDFFGGLFLVLALLLGLTLDLVLGLVFLVDLGVRSNCGCGSRCCFETSGESDSAVEVVEVVVGVRLFVEEGEIELEFKMSKFSEIRLLS